MSPLHTTDEGSLVKTANPTWSRIAAATTNPDLIAVMIFCAIGLLIASNLILRNPDFPAVLI